MRQYNRGNLSPRSLASALPQGPPYSLVNGGQAHTREAYRDLLIFEERLKQNSERLASQRRKYEAFLLSLILSIALLAYKVFISPSPYTLFQFLNSGLLLIGIVTLILFFATGVYSEKIAYAYKFVPQANRALRYFNIYLNTKKPPRNWSLFSPLSWFRIFSTSNGNATSTTSPGLSRVPSTSGLKRASRSRSPTLSSSFSSSSSPSSSPTTTRNVIPLAPLPPASNPRGELIFSSKVSTAYREGYEKYRSDWEKRRKASKPSTDQSYSKWIMSFVLPASWIKKNKPTEEEGQAVTGKVPVSPSKKKRVLHKEGGGNSTSVSYAATPSEYSDSSSVEHHHPPPASESRGRGRDATTRPLLARSGSSSSVTSSAFSTVTTSTGAPPISRRSSPLRQIGDISVNIPMTSRSSPSTPSLTISKNGLATNVNQTASSGPSSRASTPDLIPEEDEEDRQYPKYYPHNRSTKEISQRTGASSPASTSASSISIATSSQSLLFSDVPVGGGGGGGDSSRRRQYLTSATSDDSIASTSSSFEDTKSHRRTSAKARRYEDDDDEDFAEDDDALRSPPDMSPHAKEAALSDLPGDYQGMKNSENLTRRRSRASSFNEFLDELREDGL